MKFLIAVLAIRFVAGWVAGRKDKDKINEAGESRSERILHPAEFNLR